jgi:hypothetical protein
VADPKVDVQAAMTTPDKAGMRLRCCAEGDFGIDDAPGKRGRPGFVACDGDRGGLPPRSGSLA